MKLLARIFALFLFCLATPALAATAPVGKVLSLKGAANVSHDGEEMPLGAGSPIYAQDIIQTQQDGIAEIQFNDLSLVTVGSNSLLTVDNFVYNPEAPQDNGSTLRVGNGFFHFVSGKLKREKVRIDTPVSTIGIRGTELAGEVFEDGKTMVSLVKCCVDLKTESGTTSLDRIGTYSEVKTKGAKPSTADLTPDWWAEKLVTALGKSRDDLGLQKLNEAQSEQQTPPPAKPVEAKIVPKHGPADRKTFPFINR